MDRWRMDTGTGCVVMFLSPEGEYVRYEEAQQQINELKAMVEGLRDMLESKTGVSVAHPNIGTIIPEDVREILSEAPSQALTAHDNAIRAEVAEACAEKIDMLMQELDEDGASSHIMDSAGRLFASVRNIARKHKEE